MVEFIKAEEKDTFILSIIKYKVWEETYKDIYPKNKFDNFNINDEQRKFADLMRKQELYLIKYDGALAGYFSYGDILRLFETYQYELGLLYILKQYQKLHIGTKVIEYVKNKFEYNNINEFIISCNKYNKNAIKFYKKMGGDVIHIDEDDFIDKSKPQIKLLYRI